MVKERNPIVVILLTFVTCGIYALYWYFATAKEMNELGKLETSAGMILLFFFCGPMALFAIWKHANGVQDVSGGEQSAGMLFVIALVFAPAYMFMAQTELNKHAQPAA